MVIPGTAAPPIAFLMSQTIVAAEPDGGFTVEYIWAVIGVPTGVPTEGGPVIEKFDQKFGLHEVAVAASQVLIS